MHNPDEEGDPDPWNDEDGIIPDDIQTNTLIPREDR